MSSTTTTRKKPVNKKLQQHTLQLVEDALKPRSLAELHEMVGGFPFKAVKLVNQGGSVPVGNVAEFLNIDDNKYIWFWDGRTRWDNNMYFWNVKAWRLAEDDAV